MKEAALTFQELAESRTKTHHLQKDVQRLKASRKFQALSFTFHNMEELRGWQSSQLEKIMTVLMLPTRIWDSGC